LTEACAMRRATRRLRVVLYLAAAVCGVCVLGVFAPGGMLENWLGIRYGMDSADSTIRDEIISSSKMLQYCARIAYAMCTFAAMYFVLLARRPMRYIQFVQLGAAGFMCTSGVALMAGVYLHLRPLGYVTDALVMLALGVLLFVYSQPPKRRRRAHTE
jgi:hypothetical protein